MRNLLVFLLLLSPALLKAQEKPYDFKWLEQEIENLRKTAMVPGLAVGIVHRGEMVFAKGFGTRTQGKKEPVDENTLFGVASNTKAFTAMGIMMLVEEGKLSLDDKVVKYLPWFRLYNDYVSNEMTVKDLLTHHSGLKTFAGDLIWYASTHSREEVVKHSQYLSPSHDFRDKFGYSNIHYLAAGLIIEKVSGESYDEFIDERIFKPLGMTRTNSSITKNPQDNVASPHAIKGNDNIPVPYVNWDNIAPAGSINSSINDMCKWLACLAKEGKYENGSLINKENFYKMTTPVTNIPIANWSRAVFPSKHFQSYALGLNTFDYHGVQVFNHSGGLVGMVSQTVFVPEKDFGFVILSNNETGLPGFLMYDLLDFMLQQDYNKITARYIENMLAGRKQDMAEEEKKWADADPKAMPKEGLPVFAGKFSGKVYGSVTISEKTEGKNKFLHLQFDHTLSFNARMYYYKNDVFWFEFTEYPSLPRGTVTYHRDTKGKINQIVIDVPNPDFDFTELDLFKQ